MTASASNCLLCTQNYVDVNGLYAPTFSGGLWSDTLPLTNLQNPMLAYKARSASCVPSDTSFVCDLGVTRSIMAVVIPAPHNLSQSASYTISVFKDAALTVLAGTYSGVLSPVVFPFGTVPFEDQHWYNGQYTPEEFNNFKVPVVALFTTAVLGRYVQVLITDQSNPYGYIELSRLFVSPGYQPFYNMSYGAQLVPVDPSVVTKTIGGYRAFDARPKYREFHLAIQTLPNQEALSSVFDQQFALGLSGQVFFSANPKDITNLHRVSFLANLSKLNPITMAYYGYSGVAYDLIEVVA